MQRLVMDVAEAVAEAEAEAAGVAASRQRLPRHQLEEPLGPRRLDNDRRSSGPREVEAVAKDEDEVSDHLCLLANINNNSNDSQVLSKDNSSFKVTVMRVDVGDTGFEIAVAA